MKVLWFWADQWREWISSMWRVQFPHTGLVKAGYESKMASAFELESGWHPFEDWADVIVLERLLFGPWAERVQQWKKQGKKVFGTFDDAYWRMPDYIRSKPTWSKKVVREFRQMLGVIDGAIVPSENLQRDVAKFGNIHFIPNYPDLSFPAYQYAFDFPILRNDTRYVIGWGGSHYHSIKQLIPIFEQLIRTEPRVQIWIMGNARAFNLLEDIPLEHKRYFPIQPYGNYLALIKQFDVFAIPLAGKYDQCRSWIKPLEAALMGVPWVATSNRIYRGCKGGTLVKSNAEWREALLAPQKADREWALQQDITQHIEEYLEVLDG